MKRRESQAHDMTLGSNISGDAKDAAGADGHRAKALPHRKHRRFSRRSQQPQCWSVVESRFHDGSRVLGSGRDAQVGCRRRHALLDPGADAADPDDGMTCCTDSPKHFHSEDDDGSRDVHGDCNQGIKSFFYVLFIVAPLSLAHLSSPALLFRSIPVRRSSDRRTKRRSERERERESVFCFTSPASDPRLAADPASFPAQVQAKDPEESRARDFDVSLALVACVCERETDRLRVTCAHAFLDCRCCCCCLRVYFDESLLCLRTRVRVHDLRRRWIQQLETHRKI